MKKQIIFSGYRMLSICVLCVFVISCETEEDRNSVPELTTAKVEDILNISATCGASILSDGGSTIIAKGVCWSTKTDPTISDSKTDEGTGNETFESILNDLDFNTTYYVRAYATNAIGTGYGNSLSFKTLNVPLTVTDIDGNIYHTVIIGTQVWMVENLKTTKYGNGDLIPNMKANSTWAYLTTGAYCDFNNDSINSITTGRLYNWYSVNDSRKLAPAGWHVPSDAEWQTLINYLGGANIAGGKMKESGAVHWGSWNSGSTNESRFTALPSGLRNIASNYYECKTESCYSVAIVFNFRNEEADWWSSTEINNNEVIVQAVNNFQNNLIKINRGKNLGLSVRCILD